MKTDEILKSIRECGGFNNFHNWSKKDVAKWVRANYYCSVYVAKKVAEYIA